jgi:dihydroneopterin aldolase
MFGPDFYIDSFQSIKKVVTNQVFKDKTLNKAANDYIDAQTAFAKMMAHNTVDLFKYSVDSVSKYCFPQMEKASQAPYKVEKEVK